LQNTFASRFRAADARVPSSPRLPLDQLVGAQSCRDDHAGREPRGAARLALVDGPTDRWRRGQPTRWITEPRRVPGEEHMDGSIEWTDSTDTRAQIERQAAEGKPPFGASTIGQPQPTS